MAKIVPFGILLLQLLFCAHPAQAQSSADALAAADTSRLLVRQARKGIVLVGSGQNVRALQCFGGLRDVGARYANAVNRYQKAVGDSVQVYCMTIPTAIAYYCPDTAKPWTKDQKTALDFLYGNLNKKVKPVDAYSALLPHQGEDIFLRTDHHWAPLGAYYAAQAFAQAAGVPFPDTTAYVKRVVRGFVGTMFKFSGDSSVKKAPEDFVYYVPKDSSYATTYVKYRLGKKRQVIGESAPAPGDFFLHYNDSSQLAYSTFMGGDARRVSVKTGVNNGRRLLIVKDSYGNAVAGYLFSSFEEVNVIDYRYFRTNVAKYCKEKGITDLLFVNCSSLAYTPVTCSKLELLLK